MGILKSAADLVYTVRFLKLLVTDFEDTDAFKSGIIDEKGKKRKEFNLNSMDDRNAYTSYYTPFHRLVFNIKKLMAKAGLGGKVASYASALFLIKEHGGLKDSRLNNIHKDTGIDIIDMLHEQSDWFMIEGNKVSPGVYRIKNESISNEHFAVITTNDQIRIEEEHSAPAGEMFGISIYKATHLKSRDTVYVSTAEITK